MPKYVVSENGVDTVIETDTRPEGAVTAEAFVKKLAEDPELDGIVPEIFTDDVQVPVKDPLADLRGKSAEELAEYKNKELREYLEAADAPSNGNKATLVDRLIELMGDK